MDTFRNESLKFCLGLTLLIGVVLVYAGIWSLEVGFSNQGSLLSRLSFSLWIVCGLHLAGFYVAFLFREKSPLTSSWVLCITESIAIFVVLLYDPNPQYLFTFIVPILFAIVLLDLKPSAIFSGSILLAAIIIFIFHSNMLSSIRQITIPLLFVMALSVFLEFIFSQMHSILGWYHKNYLKAIINEQIIRDNEVKLEQLVNSLEDYKEYLKKTNISLIQARDEAETARNLKQSFVQNVSHELRTPLNLIIGFSETMVNAPRSYGEVNWTPDLRGDIECIYQNSQHLKALIDDILDMASLENKKYELELGKVDLNSLIHEVVLITDSSYKNKGLSLKVELTPKMDQVRGDSVRLKQVMLNLLSNALKYTRKGGVVITTKVDGPNAHVSVTDTGKGIQKEDLDKVFDAFFQSDRSNNREDYGTGLGLSISKQLIELHGGEMSISSEPGKGTTVSFTVPFLKE